jgi:D-psicose/D-tagatose/L-ribulose 3-epimerase
MHLSMHTWMREEPLERTAERLARHGYGSLSLYPRPALPSPGEVRRILSEHGLACWGVVAEFEEPLSLIAADEGRRAAAVDELRRRVELAGQLDARVVTVVPAHGAREGEASDEDRWRWAVESMRQIHADAERAGVQLAIESLNRYESAFLFRVDQALALAEATGPNCGVALDTFHLNIEETEPGARIERAGARIADFHVADTNRLACGMGHWDWPATIAALRVAGYDGALVHECVPPWSRAPMAALGSEEERDLVGRPADQLDEQAYTQLVARTAATLLPLI